MAREIEAWERRIAAAWPRVSFGPVEVRGVGSEYEIDVWVYLGDLGPDEVQVDIYADPGFHRRMERGEATAGGYRYGARVPADRPAGEYTARAIPARADVKVPLEAAQIAWQK